MVRHIEDIYINFLFEQPSECNLSLVREFYGNWDPQKTDSKFKIRGHVVIFTVHSLDVLLGIPEVDAEPLKLMNIEPLYANI